jgi:hypothetical protein
MAAQPSRVGALVASLALAASVLAGCNPGDGSLQPSDTVEPTDAPLATVPTDPSLAAALGPWRRVPFKADPAFGIPFIAGCKGAEAAIGDTPAVVVDVRGRGWITAVFASDSAAFLCRTTVDDPTDPVEVRPMAVPTGSLAQDGIDLALWTEVQSGAETITYAAGRVGSLPAEVIGGFVDQSFVFGTHANGWWIAWWPPQVASDGFAAVDQGHVVLNNVLPPEGGEYPIPS